MSAMRGTFREENWNAERRGEGTSRLETRLDGDAQREAEGDDPHWLAAKADGGVEVKSGEIDGSQLERPGQVGETDLERLRRLRLAELKAAGKQRHAWIAKGHGKYWQLEDEAAFLLRRLPTLHFLPTCHTQFSPCIRVMCLS